MHILFIHQNYPAQFGHIARYLVRRKGFRCTFLSQNAPGFDEGVERIQYQTRGGATTQTHYCSASFENATWHSHAIYQALKARPDIRPDLIVAHSGYFYVAWLRELYTCPIINYFEYYYRTTGLDLDRRPDFPYPESNNLRAPARNAAILLDLENCDLGYSPTSWQRNLLPGMFHDKLRVVFDGIDTSIWQPWRDVSVEINQRTISPQTRLVTYVARGMESVRGFDIFMKLAKILYTRFPDLFFVVVGLDRVCYGGDAEFTGDKSFREWVLSQDSYDLSKFSFVGLVPPLHLARLLSVTRLHLYLSVPFILSWSLMDALACGATVLASDTSPVREMIEHGTNGLLADLYDLEGMATLATRVLEAPDDFRHLGQAAVEMIRQQYSLEVCLPRMLELYQEASSRKPGGR
jgi:glycosyltransferase involved in cell wall biosynthesis